MEIKNLYTLFLEANKVTTDTRVELKKSIFFALKGENFNGNEYADEALKKGADYVIIDEEEYKYSERTILVDNVLECLQGLARYHRQQLNIPVIALTGSNGKTTTKELINAVLSRKYKCVATKGNLNNHIGVPLTLLSLQKDTEIAVVEMGANHPNEIASLCEIALPDFGYITNFGKVHLEGFGSLEGVIKAKTELYRFLKENNKTVFVNINDKVQIENSNGMIRISFGSENSDYSVSFLHANPFVSLRFKDLTINSKLIGKYNFLNIATAIAIGKHFEVADKEIKSAIENYIPSNNRSQIVQKDSNEIILDAYNANPNSMEVALENLSQLTCKNKVAILGDMFEIGENTIYEHQNIVEIIEKSNIDKAFLIGDSFNKLTIENPNIFQFKSFKNFKSEFGNFQIKEATILIKASRGMALEQVLDLM